MGDLGETYTGLSGKTKDDFGHGEAKFIPYLNVFRNTITDSDMLENIELDTTQNEVKYGDIFFTTSSETAEEVGMSSIWLSKKENVYLNSFCFGFRPKKTYDPYFMGYLLRSQHIRDKIIILAQGISRYNISKNKVIQIPILMPKDKEQTQIGNFFQKFDELITLHQRKLENLKRQKKSLLQKMFSKNGEQFPELRFPNYTDAWEQWKLGDLGRCQSGIGFPDKEQGGEEGIPFFKVSDMNISENEIVMKKANNYVTIEQIEKNKWKVIKTVPAIIFAKVGAAVMLNRKRMALTPFLIDNNTMTYIFNERWDVLFGKVLFDNIDLTKLVQNGALPSYNAKDVEALFISMPHLKEEQTQIGTFFQKFDELITLHQRKLENLQILKKGFLQQMFV